MSTTERPRRATPRRAVAAWLAGALVALAGCSAAPAAPGGAGTAPATGPTVASRASYPLTVTDCGKEVTLPREPKSVLTIGTDAVSLLAAAGAVDRISARTGEFNAPLPDDLAARPNAPVVDPGDPTTEAIIGAGVDTVIGYGLFKADAKALAQAGITVLTIAGECGHDSGGGTAVTFDLVYDDILRYGKIFGTTPVAEQAIAGLRDRVTRATAAVAQQRRSAVALYHFSSTASMSAYGGGGVLNSGMHTLGLDNVFAAEKKSYVEVSGEQVLKSDPDVVILVYGIYGESREQAMAQLLAEPGVKDMAAIRANRVIAVLGNQTAASPSAVSGLESLAAQLAKL